MTEASLFARRSALALVALFAGAMAPARAENPQPLRDMAASITCTAPAKPMARLELVFAVTGRTPSLQQSNWARFLAQEVGPRFPKGFTVFAGQGQWRNAKGEVSRESSRLLLIWHEPGADTEAKIEEIRTIYKKRFHQQSVLRADGVSCVSF